MATSGNIPLLGFGSGAPGSIILLGFGPGGDAPSPPGDSTDAYTQVFFVALSVTGLLVTKDPSASDWPKGLDWTTYLARVSDDEVISASEWTVSGPDADMTPDDESIVTGGLKTQVRLSGGTTGGLYTVTNSITTDSGIHEDRSFLVLVEEQ